MAGKWIADGICDNVIDYDGDGINDITGLKYNRLARVAFPQPKKAVTIRIDSDVLDWFKKGGKGYQSRMNVVLLSISQRRKPDTVWGCQSVTRSFRGTAGTFSSGYSHDPGRRPAKRVRRLCWG